MNPSSRIPRDVLSYDQKAPSRSVIRRHYAKWRDSQSIPRRCDIQDCQFFSMPLTWRDKALPLILDHVNGNNKDNNPSNLRYVCPNCDSQLQTRGGANRGRVTDAIPEGYTLNNRDGTQSISRAGVSYGCSSAAAQGIALKLEPE